MSLNKVSVEPSFFLYFPWEIRKKRSHWPGGQSAPRLYYCYNLCPKKYMDSTAIQQRACQCTDSLSATHSGQGAAVSARCWTWFLLKAHLAGASAAHWPRKSENWELEIEDRSLRLSYGWLVSNTADDCLQRQIAQKKIQIENWSSSYQGWSLHSF